jgi:hypothetical protein
MTGDEPPAHSCRRPTDADGGHYDSHIPGTQQLAHVDVERVAVGSERNRTRRGTATRRLTVMAVIVGGARGVIAIRAQRQHTDGPVWQVDVLIPDDGVEQPSRGSSVVAAFRSATTPLLHGTNSGTKYRDVLRAHSERVPSSP